MMMMMILTKASMNKLKNNFRAIKIVRMRTYTLIKVKAKKSDSTRREKIFWKHRLKISLEKDWV